MIKDIAEKIISGKSVKAVFFGDSITEGFFNTSIPDSQSVYHKKLSDKIKKYFPASDFKAVNAGIGGNTSQDGLKRIERDVISHSPDIVSVCFGLNDSNNALEAYIDTLSKIFDKLRAENITIMFMTPNMLNTSVCADTREDLKEYAAKTAGYQNSGKMDEFMNAAVRLCGEYPIPVCDCYSKWKSLSDLGVDTNLLLANRINHPVPQMHELFADCLFETFFWA